MSKISAISVRLLRHCNFFNVSAPLYSGLHTSAILEAARKGTREKARKKKVKVELKKVGFIPHNLRINERLKASKIVKRSVEVNTDEPLDAVFCIKDYKTISYSVPQVVYFHREINHPTMLNRPNAAIQVQIELNMVAEKKTRFMDSFNRIVKLPHVFGTYEDRTVLAFCKTPEQIDEALNAGADLAGGLDLLHKVQSGNLPLDPYRYVVAHTSMLTELVPVRGILKKKFPMQKFGTLGIDLTAMITRFKVGLQYRADKDDDEHDLGIIKTPIGSLEMDPVQLEENFKVLIKDVEEARPNRPGEFITWVWCTAAPSPEKFKLDHLKYLETQQS